MSGSCFRLIFSVVPALTFCEEPNRSWDTLMQSIQTGRSVVVTRMNSAQLEGPLLEITSESITVKSHGRPQVVPRGEVYRVRYANIRRRHTLTVMAAAATACAIFAGAKADTYKGASALLAGGICAGGGAAVGGALPIGKPLFQLAGPPPRRPAQPRDRK